MLYLMLRYPSGFPAFLVLSALMFGCQAVSRAQDFPGEPRFQERASVAQGFAAERLSFWQKRLFLGDWKISVIVARAADLRPQTVGNIHWDRDARTAVIRVLDPADYHMEWQPMLRDMEFTVVHELIHLELAPVLSDLQRSEANRKAEEYTVNHLTEALLQLAAPTAPGQSQPAITTASSAK